MVVDFLETAEIEPALTLDGVDVGGTVGVGMAEHLAQMVEVEVRVTVETVLVGIVTVEPLVVIVLVTGHVVTVVYVTRVVVNPGTAEVEPALTLDRIDPTGVGIERVGLDTTGVVTAVVVVSETVVTPAVHLVQRVEVDVIVTVEIVLDVVKMYEEPVVMVAVTGHSVVVVYVTTVTVDSGGAEELPGAEGLWRTGEEPKGPAGEVAGKLLLGLGPTDVDLGDEAAGGALADVASAGVVTAGEVSFTGQTVVEIAMVEVTTEVESAGQLVMVGAQLVIVTSLVVYTVEIVHLADEVLAGEVLTGAEGAGAEEKLKRVEDALDLLRRTETDEPQAPVPRGSERASASARSPAKAREIALFIESARMEAEEEGVDGDEEERETGVTKVDEAVNAILLHKNIATDETRDRHGRLILFTVDTSSHQDRRL